MKGVTREGSGPAGVIWAYTYQIVPPQPKGRLRGITALLAQEHQVARRGSRRWAGRLLLGSQMTQILIVSDRVERNREINQKLEAELRRLKVEFDVTEPVALPGHSAAAEP